MHICAFSTSTTTTTQAVWNLWTQTAQWSLWDQTLKSAELHGPFRQGATGILTHQDGSKAPFTVVACHMLQGYVLSIPLGMGVEMLVKRELKPEGEKVHFRQEVTLMGPAMAKLLHGTRKKTLQVETLQSIEGMLKCLRGELTSLAGPAQTEIKPEIKSSAS